MGESTLPSSNANVAELDSYGRRMPLLLTMKESKHLEIFVCLARETRRNYTKEDLKCLSTDFSTPGRITEPSRVALFPTES